MSVSHKNKILAAWDYLKGSPEEFPLQSRIYHSICIATFLVILYNVPFSLAVGLYRMTFLSSALLIFQAFFYYLSRFKGKLHLSMVIYAIVINLFFAFDFYFSSGIQGATLHSFTITYFLIITIAQKKHYWYWTISNLILVIGLVVYEYYHPEIIHFRYSSRSNQYIDITSTYIVSVILIFACVTYIINNYGLEKKIAEQNASAMKRLSEEKSKLLSIISHDFRTPLRNIQIYLHMLRQNDLGPTDRRHLEVELAKDTEEAKHLLDNLLLWSKRQLGGTNLNLEHLELAEVLGEISEKAMAVSERKQVNFISEIPKGLKVLADREMLQIIVRNLLSNAIKFSNNGGTVKLLVEDQGKDVKLNVVDNGIGMDEEIQRNMFSLNVNPSYGTNAEKGVGLGMVISQDLAHSQDIDISFQSQKGIGTTFTLTICSSALA